MAKNKQQRTSQQTDSLSTWTKPYDWAGGSFFGSTPQGRRILESYQEAREAENERRRRQAAEAAEEKRRKEAEQKRIEEIRRQDRERAKRNAEIYRKQNEERQRRLKEERDARAEQTKKDKAAADEVEERDFLAWASDSPFWKNNFFGRRFFDVKNMLGSLVTSSIDTNGTTINGKISMNELRKQAADAHDKMLDLERYIQSIEQQRDMFDELYGMDPEYLNQNQNNPQVKQYWERRSQFDKAIENARQKMNDPALKGLDDAYKQFYVADRTGIGTQIWNDLGDAFTDATTYEQYMPQVRARRKQEQLAEYERLVSAELAKQRMDKYKHMPYEVAAKHFQEDLKENLRLQFDPNKDPIELQRENVEARRKSENVSTDQMRQQADNEIAELREEYIQNRTHLRDSEEYWNVSEGFKMNTAAHQNDALYNPYYYLYNVAPIIGSSVSSPKQAVGTVIKGAATIGGLALAPFTEGGSLALMTIGEIAATPFEWQGAKDENYAEVGDRRIENIMNMLQDTGFTGEGDNQEYTFSDGKTMRFDDPRFPEYLKEERKSTYDRVIEELKNRSRKAWEKKGWKKEWIDEHLDGAEGDKHAIQDYISGITSGALVGDDGKPMFNEFMHPAFQKALIYSTAGLQAQFDADNMRTMGKLPVQKGLMLLPTKWVKSGLGFIDKGTAKLGSKFANRIERDAAGRVTVRTAETAEQTVESGARKAAQGKYANGFRRPERTFTQAFSSGYSKGSEIGDALGFGYAGHVVGGIAGGTLESTAHAARQMLSPRLRAAFDGIENKAMIKYQAVLDKLTPEKAWQQALLKYGVKATGRNVGIGFLEAAEEAVQYLNSQEDFAAKYGWAGMSLGDMISNDLKQGGRVLDAYMSLVGLSNSPLKDDEEFWSNLKGGFILGALPMANPSGIIQTVGNTVHGYNEYKTHEAMVASGVMNREYDKMNRASNAEMARQAFRGNEQHVLETIDNMEAADRRRETPFFTQEDYDEKRKAAQAVMGMTKNEKIREMLEAKGIQYGTERYAHAIADLYSLTEDLNANEEQSRDVNTQRTKLYNSEVFQNAVQQTVERVMQESQADKDAVEEDIRKAGEQAVIDEIDTIREELQLDPNSKKYSRTINKPEYKQRIETARQQAEESARQEIEQNMRNAVSAKTKLVNKLTGLISMRARQNTVDDFYNFLTSKFGLKPMRPDAKTIRDNVDAQIKEAKAQLAEITRDTSNAFNENMSDADALEWLEKATDVVHTSDLQLQELEGAAAMLQADRAVTQSYYNLFTEGLVKNKEGKYEYNPVEFKKQQERNRRRANLLRSGRIDEFKADLEQQSKEEYTPANPEDSKNNKYGRRIDAIIEANKRNTAIDWAINEVYNGDAINKLNEVFEEEDKKAAQQQNKEVKQQVKAEQQEENPFESSSSEQSETSEQVQEQPVASTTTRTKTPQSDESESAPQQSSEETESKWQRTSEKRKEAFDRNRKKYEERKKRAKETYERNKKRIKDWSRATLKAGIPFQDTIMKAANALIYAAKDGTYKFAQLVEDFKEIAEDIDIKDALPALKKAYNKRYAYYALNDDSVLNNMSTPDEVSAYGRENDGRDKDPDPVVIPVHQKIQEQLDKDSNNIVEEISSHYDIVVDDGISPQIYTNTEAVEHSKYGETHQQIKSIVDKLQAANTSDESFRSAIKEVSKSIPTFPVETFVKYRNVSGIELAVARKYVSWVPNRFVENGIKVRNAVISILLGKDVSEQDFPGNFAQFKKDILEIKANLEGLGLTILNTQQYIYGINNNGARVASQADIIAADDKGKVYVIDVRSGYKSIRERYSTSFKAGIGFTIEDQVRDQLKQIEQIINQKFKIPVKGLYCLPVIFNNLNEQGIRVEKDENERALIPVKSNSDRTYSNDVEQQKKNAKELVDKINEQINEYNNTVKEAKKYSSEYSEIERIELEEYTTAQEYTTYTDRLHAKYDDLNSRISDMNQAIQNSIDTENMIWNEQMEQNLQELPSHETAAYAQRLSEACKELDITLQYIPRLKATTQIEKENVKKLYQVIFDAQKALDDLLQDPNASLYDVKAEEELITTAMEILTENKENFGRMSVMMRKWWADNFVVGKGDNTQQGVLSLAQQAAGFVNTINSWVDTLSQHVLTELDSREALQEWYSSILNRYFSKLLDNATAFAEQQEPALKVGIQTVVARGRQLIDLFNENWGTLPDEEFQGPPANEAERINRMPIRWKNLYGSSTSHSPAFDAMANSVIYYIMSTRPTFISNYLTQSSVADNPDNKATRFTLYEEKSGEIKLRINWWDGRQWKYEELPFTINIGNYPNATDEEIARFTAVNRANKKFTRKVKRMLEYTKKHPEYKLEFTVSVDKGSINYDKNGVSHNVSEFLFKGGGNEHDLYTVSLSADSRIGIGVFISDHTTGNTFYDVRAGKNLTTRIGGFDETFSKQHLNTQNGAIVYFYDSGNGNTIGVPIQSSQIGVESANMLVDLIRRYVNGERQYQGYDILGLLKQRLYIADPTRQLSKYNNITNMITINTNGEIVIGNESYDLTTRRNALVERIAAMSNSTPAEILSDNMTSSNDLVLQQARNQFTHDGSLSTITLPNGFVLNREDFTHRNADGTQGSTWLGYLLRNGILGTRATSKGYRQVNIDNLCLVDKNNPIQMETKPSVEDRANARRRRVSMLSQVDDPFAQAKGGLAMTVDEASIDVNRGAEEQEDFVNAVREYFKQVFGTDADVVFEDAKKNFIKEAAKNQRVIGLCTSEMIKLSRYAPYSAMYHEAFHKILELVLPDEKRKEFYDIYRKHNGNALSERSVAEGLADLFVDYMMKRILPKNAKWYNKVFRWFKSAGFALNMAWNYGISDTRKMYTVYHNMNNGTYANIEVSKQAADRFKREFNDELYYTVNGVDLQQIADSGQLQEMVKALSYYILESYGIDRIDPDVKIDINTHTPNRLSKEIIDSLTAEGVPTEELTAVDLAFREILKKGERVPIIAQKGKDKGKTIGYEYEYPNFAAIRKNIADYISEITGAYAGRIQDETDETIQDDGENRDVQNMNIDRYDRASYEFSKLEGTNRRVKLFFSTIPYCTFDEEGKVVEDYSRNIYECPTYMPLDEVYNVIVNRCHDAQNIQDLDNKLRIYAEHSPMGRMVYSKYHELIQNIYIYNEDGNITKIDYDKEAFAIQILSAIRSQKLDFMTALSKTLDDGSKEVRVVSSSLDRDSRRLPDQWTQFLQAGQVSVFARTRDKNGNFVFRDGMGGRDGKDVFSRTAKFISDLRLALSRANSEFTIDGKDYNKDTLENIAVLKQELLTRLHTIGIIFSREALDHMLLTQYGDMGADGMLNWLSQTGTSSINTFLDRLADFTSSDGTPNKSAVEKGYSDLGFVRDLAKWQGAYSRITTQQMALGLNGKRLYSVSQNSSISHIINMLNTQDADNETIRTLSRFGFNITSDELVQGSIILKAIRNKKAQHIEAHTYIGFKTDNQGDQGSEYTEEATIEDYIAKMTMLQNGYLIFPTLADKGTWMILSGVEMPGIRFEKVTEKNEQTGVTTEKTVVRNAPTIKWFNGEPYIMPSDDIINQMLEYANTERLAIQQCMEDLGYTDIDGYELQGRSKLPKEALIKNYHTPNKDKKTKKVIEPNGTRFLSLTKIVVKEKEGDRFVMKEYNLNDPNMSSSDLLKLANEKFFNKSYEEQKEIMALTLAIQNRHEIESAINLGLVERIDIEESWKDKSGVEYHNKVESSAKNMMNLQSSHLNQTQIEALTAEIMRSIPSKEYGTWSAIPNGREKNFKYKIARSLAIAAMLGDATNRAIISSQEVMRCFSGHPAEFKVDYDVAGGKIKDSAYDIQKRIGGMISTGDDNVLDLPGIPSTYTCAECNDYEVSSSSDIASRLEEMFINGAVREMYGIKTGDWNTAYSTESIDNLIKNADSSIKASLKKAKADGLKFAKAFDGGINVADGASYITDTMCENMLRMRGAYSEDIKKAFDILRSDDTKYNWTAKRDAYKAIYDAANIVTTKYTAYGFRDHMLNEESMSDVAVAYYNKFALFPLFPCIATGKMKGIYDKMLDEKVDMLFMTSAVKVGSQGAVDFDGNVINVPFNKYVQSYAYLRRQLNTDPEEGDKIPAGTQAMKIGLQNLRLGRTNYTDSRTGEQISGQLLLDKYMNSIKQLAINGMYELRDMFFYEDTNQIDPEKLSKYLKEQLSSRNANKGLIEAIQVTIDPNTGQKKLVCPLAATSDATWIESILISTVNRKIIDIVTPGSSFVQRSVFAIEGKNGEGAIQSDENMSPEINNGEKLQMINEDGSMDAVISMDYFDDIIFKGKLKDMSFDEKRQWLFDNGVIGKGTKANTIGYRIPTQAQSSIHGLRFVDVVSAVKSTIILPEEFTKITGSDFDIDHLYLMSYNYNVGISEDGVQYVTTSFNPVEDDGKYSDQYHQNTIIDCLMTLLKDSGNSINSLYKSIDNDTELITSIADQVPETGSTKDEPFNFGTLHEQVARKNDYITGKTGIGPFALNVTNQILTQLYGVKFRDTQFTTATGIHRLDHLIDVNDNAISSWLSAFINAHVDIVKDPYISRLNVNPFTYNMMNLMVRSGFGDVAVWFMAQPIIRDMANASEQAKSQFARDPEKGKSTYAATEYAIKEAISKYLTEGEMTPEVINKYTYSADKRDISVRINTVNWIKEHEAVLAEIAKNPAAETVTVDGVVYRTKEVQRTAFYAWKTLEKYSIALGDLVQHTKIDTRKHGKSLIAINLYLDAYNKLFHQDPRMSLWDIDSLQSLIEGSWIDIKTNLAIAAPSSILSQQTFAANPQFIRAVINLANILSTTGGSLNIDTLNLISRSLQTAVKSKYIIRYAKEKLGKSDADIAGLFIGPRSMNKRLIMLKNAIETNPKYSRLKNNHLINQIYSVIEDLPTVVRGKLTEKPGFITILDNTDDSRVNSDLLIDGWTDLLNDEDAFVRNFARDLIVYSFLTSGEFKGWNKMFKFVPPAWIRGEIDTDFQSFSEYIENALNMSSSDYTEFFDDIISNNFMDYRISRRVPQVNSDKTENFIDVTSIIKIGKAVDEQQLNAVEPYITVKDDKYTGKGVAAYNLYQLAGFVNGDGGYHPVYAKMKKKGYHGKKTYDIYEYGWSFGYAENENEAANEFDFASALERVQQYLIHVQYDMDISTSEASARAITDVFLGRTEVASKNTTDNIIQHKDLLQSPKEIEKKKVWIRASRNYNRKSVQNDPTTLYIFTDNTDRTSGGQRYEDGWYKEKYGEGGFGSENNPTTAQIRGLENAAPISTMRYFYRSHEGMKVADARWKDSDIEEFKTVIDSEIEDIKRLWDTGRFTKIISPAGDGFFNSRIAQITRNSEIGSYLYDKLQELYTYVNQPRQDVETLLSEEEKIEAELYKKMCEGE